MKSIVLFVLAFGAVAAQPLGWDIVQMAPAVSGSDLCFLADGRHGWMVGTGGTGGDVFARVFATDDGGGTWSTLPFPDSSTAAIEGIFFTDSMNGWVVGNGGYVKKTTDAGLTWQTQTSPSTRKLHRVHFVSPATGWITGGWSDGSAFLLLKTTNGGGVWEDLSFGSNCFSCEDIWFTDSLHGWLVGHDASLNPFIQHTTDGGANWNAQTAPLPTGSGPVSSVCFPTSLIGWATSSSIYQTPSGSILHTTNGGDSWYVQAVTNLNYNYAIDAPDTLHAAILSTQVLSPQAGKVFRTTNGGAGWSSANLPTYSYGSGCQYRGNDLWVCQDYSQILHSADNGTTWEWQLYAPFFRSVEWSSPAVGWLVAGSSTGPGYCLKTTDAGLTWIRDANAPGGAQVQFFDGSRGWMLQEGNSAKVNRTTDGGANWAQFGLGTSNWVGRMRFATADSGWACGSNGTMRFTMNGGASWTSQSLGTTSYCEDVFMLNSSEGWAAGGYGGGSGFIRHTTNGGATWTTQNPAQADHFNRIFFLNSRQGWIGAYGGLVQRTTDGGATWGVVGSVPHTYFEDAVFIDSLTGWAAAGNASGGGDDGRGFVYKTTNGGVSWTQEYRSSLSKGWIQDLDMQPGGTLWACGNHSGLIKNVGVQWVEERLTPDAYRPTLTVTPNPSRGACNIRLAVPGSTPLQLVISDAAGRVVRELTASGQDVTWDGKDRSGRPVPDGIYFCRCSTPGQGTPAKLCLNRQ